MSKQNSITAYFFGNMYISQIAHGIQASHVLTEMFVKYKKTSPEKKLLFDWGKNHKTIHLYNGGYQSKLQKIYNVLKIVAPVLEIPFAKFHEEQDALNSALTSVGFIVPADMLDFKLKDYEIQFVDDISLKPNLKLNKDLANDLYLAKYCLAIIMNKVRYA